MKLATALSERADLQRRIRLPILYNVRSAMLHMYIYRVK